MSEIVELVVSCNSWQEAQAIADVLLEKNLMDDVEIVEVKDHFGQIEKVKLLMSCTSKKINEIELFVATLSNGRRILMRS